MKRKIYFSFFLCAFLSAAVSGSSFEFNDRLQEAYLKIVRLRFEDGKKLLDEEQRLNPSNTLPLLYYSYIDFLTAFISEEKSDFETFTKNSESRLKKIKDTDSPFSLYSQAELMLQDVMLRVKFREFIPAAWEIRRAYKIIGKNIALHPAFPLNKKISGFLNVLVGSVPKDYHWLVNLAGMEGSIQQGTNELYSLLRETEGTSYKVYKDEILFYLGIIHNSLSKSENNSAELVELMKPLCSQSLLIRYCYSNVMQKAGRNEEVLQALTDTSNTSGTYPFYFLSYKTGMAKLNHLDFTAEKDFQKFIAYFHGMNYLRSAYQKLAWIYLLQGNQKKYSEYMLLCKSVGKDFVDEDKDATAEAGTGEAPNPFLLRSRLLFDGGYYRQSLAEISGKQISNFPRYRDQLEVTYRFARIFHKMNLVDKAVGFFEQTLKNGSTTKYYFAANSALLLGNIYEEKNDRGKAKQYYELCLSLRNHEYQNSIDQKAEAGLQRLGIKK